MSTSNNHDQFKKWVSIINESDMSECGMDGSQQPTMTINTNVSNNGDKSVNISAQGSSADELLRLLKMAGMEHTHVQGMDEGSCGYEEELLLPPQSNMQGGQSDGECGCNSWSCKTCFPDDGMAKTPYSSDEMPAANVCSTCGHEANGPLHELECGMREELVNDEGEESPLTFGDKNLGEGGMYEEEKSREEKIKDILGMQMLGFSQVEEEYTQEMLEQMNDDELDNLFSQVKGDGDLPGEQPEMQEPEMQEPANAAPEQPSNAEAPDEEVMEWVKRFKRI